MTGFEILVGPRYETTGEKVLRLTAPLTTHRDNLTGEHVCSCPDLGISLRRATEEGAVAAVTKAAAQRLAVTPTGAVGEPLPPANTGPST